MLKLKFIFLSLFLLPLISFYLVTEIERVRNKEPQIKDNIVWETNKVQIMNDIDFRQSTVRYIRNKMIEYRYKKEVGIDKELSSKMSMHYRLAMVDSILFDCVKLSWNSDLIRMDLWISTNDYPLGLDHSLSLIILNNSYKNERLKAIANELQESVTKYSGTFKYSEPKIESIDQSKHIYSVKELTTGIVWLVGLTYRNNRVYWNISIDEKTYNNFLGNFKF